MIKILNAPGKVSYVPTHTPFPYQVDAYNEVVDKEYAAIFHEQGLGKTKIAIDVALSWLSTSKVDSVIFVTKKGLVKNWRREIGTHTSIRPWILGSNAQDNFVAMNSPARFYVTHYEMIKTSLKGFLLFMKTRDVGLILDEAQKIKNPDSELTKAFYEISAFSPKRLILTGTPIANRPHDIWSLVYFLDHGKALGESYSEFKNNLELSKNLASSSDQRKIFESALQKIRDAIAPFAVRETKDGAGIDLPNKELRVIRCEWETVQLEMYNSYLSELRNYVFKDGRLQEDRVDQILKKLTRLIQTASNPVLVDANYDEGPGKLQYLFDLLHVVFQKNEKAIVWSSFTENVDWLAKQLSSFGAVKIHGKMNIENRDKSVQSFINDKDVKVLIATPASAKEGLTLTVANHVIFYDRSFSLDDFLQAQDRVHRISQTRTCFVTSLVMEDSIDEWVDRLLAAKEVSAKFAQGDIDATMFRDEADFSFFDELTSFIGADGE